MDLLRVHSQDLHEHIAQEVGECLESGLYTDLAIRCAEGQTLHAHRVVMAAVSPYLQALLEANELNDDVQTIEMSQVSTDEMQMLLEVVYNGVVEATIEDLRKLILLAHRLYIAIPLSNELMQGLELKLPPRSPFRKPLMPKFTNGIPSGILSSATSTPRSMLSSSLKSMFNGSVFSNNSHNSMTPVRPPGSMGSTAAAKENAAFAKANTPKLNIDPTTMTTILAHSQNNEHVCPICNSKYSNVGNFKQHMKTHDNEELREQRNAILSEMIATCFNPQTSLYTCHVCNSNYNHSGNFKQHLLKHERESGSISATLVAQAGANPHLTNVLQSAMADRVDSGDKPAINQYQYQCEHCDRSFKHPGNYKQHLASHMKSTKFSPSSVTNTINKVNSLLGQQKLPLFGLPGTLSPGVSNSGGPDLATAAPSMSSGKIGAGDSMQMVACPECHLEFPGIDLLQAHISVSHKHLDVKLPSSSAATNAANTVASTASVANTANTVANAASTANAGSAASTSGAAARTSTTSQDNEGSNGSNTAGSSTNMISGGVSPPSGPLPSGPLGGNAPGGPSSGVIVPVSGSLPGVPSGGVILPGGVSSQPSWHAALVEAQEPFKCTICGKGFQKTSKLTAHMKIHRAPEEHYNHPCDICGKKFTRPQHVARHKMLHTGERPFKCPKCPRQFTREDKLRHHLSESECGGGTGLSGESSSPVSMGMPFGTLWGGANGEMLAGIYNSSTDAETTNGNDSENAMDQSTYGTATGVITTSEASNDSNSNMQVGVPVKIEMTT